MVDAPTLVRLEDTDLTLADPADDVRGRTVLDTEGAELGEVDALVIDQDDRRVRLLEVASGGFLGIGEQKMLVPVDAVTDVDEDKVRIAADRDKFSGGPGFDPELVLDRDTAAPYYNHYGFAPFWTPGYVPPAFPFARL